MRHRDLASAMAFLVLAVAVGVQAARFPMGTLRRVGPGFFPLLLALCLALLALALLLKALRSAEPVPVAWPARWAGLLLVVAAILGYAVLLTPLGFLPTTFLFTFLVFKFADPGRWFVPLAGSSLTTGLSFILFKQWLAIPFPAGFLGF